MQTLEEYRTWYAKHTSDEMILDIFKLSQENGRLTSRNHEITQEMFELSQRNTTEIIHLKEKFVTLHNPDAVTTPRMLACQNPYMIEEHTKKKNNASEST